ncbi:chloride channel, voltage-sensitive 7 [Pelomyxa schiedti]|nr:chloride channel, voltage-sensitive 7 [Pelomyxa schiedti]
MASMPDWGDGFSGSQQQTPWTEAEFSTMVGAGDAPSDGYFAPTVEDVSKRGVTPPPALPLVATGASVARSSSTSPPPPQSASLMSAALRRIAAEEEAREGGGAAAGGGPASPVFEQGTGTGTGTGAGAGGSRRASQAMAPAVGSISGEAVMATSLSPSMKEGSPEYLGSYEEAPLRAGSSGGGDEAAGVGLSLRMISQMHAKAQQYESSNLDKLENQFSIQEQKAETKVGRWKYFAGRWLCVAIIALVVTVFAFILHEGMVWGRNLSWYLVELVGWDTLSEKTAAGVVFVVVGSTYGIAAGLFIYFMDPTLRGAATEVLCYLNGIVITDTLKIKNLIAHTASLTLVTASPMCVGKEGPMLAIGSQIGHAVAKICKYDEYDMRDMVCTGLGAGIACAFGAPAGAVLFTLEKGSHFTGGLMQRLLFCTMLACFCLSFLITGVDDGLWGYFSIDSLCHFGTFSDAVLNNVKQVVAFVIMGILGGILGAVFNILHLSVIRYRKFIFKTPLRRFIEVIAIVVVSGVIAVTMSGVLKTCMPIEDTTTDADLPTIFCPAGSYNSAATLFMNSQENAMNFLFHEATPVSTLVLTIFGICFFAISVYSIGCGVPAGFFMPSLLLGAAVGRLIGELFRPEMEVLAVDPGLMAFIGAAGVLGGVCRMPVSLSVILSEAVNQGSWSLFLMVTLLIAKFVGDIFTPGITTIDFRFKDYPILEWSAPSALRRFGVQDVMHQPVVTLAQYTTRERVKEVLASFTHNAFAIVHCKKNDPGVLAQAPLLGVILRSQLITIIENMDPSNSVIDLTQHSNHAITVPTTVSSARAFNIFRTLGLRHLVVVDTGNVPVGMITRKDLFFLHAHAMHEEKKAQNKSLKDRFTAILYGHSAN